MASILEMIARPPAFDYRRLPDPVEGYQQGRKIFLDNQNRLGRESVLDRILSEQNPDLNRAGLELLRHDPAAARSVLSAASSRDDREIRRQEIGRSQSNADRSFGLQQQQFNLQRDQANRPEVVMVDDPDSGVKVPYLRNRMDGSVRPMLPDQRAAPQAPLWMQSAMPGQQIPQGAPTQPSALPPRPPGVDAATWRREQTKALVEGSSPEAKLRNEQSLRKEYEANAKTYLDVRRGYERVLASRDDAAGDISLIFGYMKMLDPGSVVREGEFATAQNSAGIPDMLRNAYNRALAGTRLNPDQRSMFRGQAQALYSAADREHQGRTNQFRSIVERYNLDPTRVIPDYGSAPGSTAPSVPPLPPGFQEVR